MVVDLKLLPRQMVLIFGLIHLLAGGVFAIAHDGSCEPAIFRQVAAERGINFVHDRGATENRHNPETMGSGFFPKGSSLNPAYEFG